MSNKWFNLTVVIVVSFAYFILFIPPNLTGARNPNMLAAFNIDEYGMFSAVVRMISSGPSLYQTLRNLLFHGHYYYGYPFYLTSAVAILPLKTVLRFTGINSTTGYMLILRQLSPLFMLIAIILLIYLWTEFKSLTRSLFLFAFLGSIPSVFGNNMWWHPDSLATLFVVLTIFSLSRDSLRFGKWFYLAACFCGLTAGIKVIGLYFFLTVAVYLVLGVVIRRVKPKALLRYAISFLIVMVLAIIASNPQLLVPETATAILSTRIAEAKYNVTGWGVQMERGPLLYYAKALRSSFGFWWIYVLIFCTCISGIVCDRKNRLLNIIILTWIIPLSVHLLFFTARQYAHYFIPVMLPLMSCIGNPTLWDFRGYYESKKNLVLGLTAFAILLCGLQLGYYTKSNAGKYMRTVNRERESPSIGFYRELDETYLSKLPESVYLTVFREPHVYVPPLQNLNVRMKWGRTDYGDIESIYPDLILLEKSYIEQYADPEILKKSLDPGQAQRSHEFYLDAQNDSLKGFRKLLETDFGVAFVREMDNSLMEEVIIEDFQTISENWSPYTGNNVIGRFTVEGEIAEFACPNAPSRRDVFAYKLWLRKPLSSLDHITMKVDVQENTFFSVDLTTNRGVVQPRHINYYEGPSGWQELTIPVPQDETLHEILISISEPAAELSNANSVESRKVLIDWIKGYTEQ